MKDRATELNCSMEEDEKRKKDELKQKREWNGPPVRSQISPSQFDRPMLHCTELGCDFIRQSKAGLVNHTRQRHDRCCGSDTAAMSLLQLMLDIAWKGKAWVGILCGGFL